MTKGDIETYYDDGRWKNRAQGNERASATYDRKSEAQSDGRRMAVDRGVDHVIKRQDGTIQEKNTYPRSRDPHPPKG